MNKDSFQTYLGVKIVLATLMTRLEYNEYRGWKLPSNEDGKDEGYLVEYLDGGEPNHPDHDGYISWCPKDVFEKSNRPIDGMSFSMALDALKAGEKVYREGWNGKGMFLFLVPGSTFKVNRPPLNVIYPEGTEINYHPHIDMRTADGTIEPWSANQSDMLSEDWGVIVDI